MQSSTPQERMFEKEIEVERLKAAMHATAVDVNAWIGRLLEEYGVEATCDNVNMMCGLLRFWTVQQAATRGLTLRDDELSELSRFVARLAYDGLCVGPVDRAGRVIGVRVGQLALIRAIDITVDFEEGLGTKLKHILDTLKEREGHQGKDLETIACEVAEANKGHTLEYAKRGARRWHVWGITPEPEERASHFRVRFR